MRMPYTATFLIASVQLLLAEPAIEITTKQLTNAQLQLSWPVQSLVPAGGVQVFAEYQAESSSDLIDWTPASERIVGTAFAGKQMSVQVSMLGDLTELISAERASNLPPLMAPRSARRASWVLGCLTPFLKGLISRARISPMRTSVRATFQTLFLRERICAEQSWIWLPIASRISATPSLTPAPCLPPSLEQSGTS